MATVLRGPLFSPARSRLPKAQEFISAGLAQRLEGPFPFRQRDFPTAPPKALPKAQEFVSAGLAQRLEGPYPLRMRDFPLPQRRDSPRARDTLLRNPEGVKLVVRLPFLQTDWELPAQPRVKAQDFVHPNWYAVNRPPSVFPPFIQNDWEPPATRRVAAKDWVWTNDLPRRLETRPPFINYDFPLAARRDSPRARDYAFVNDLPRRVEIIPPFWNTDWPAAAHRDSPRARDYLFVDALAALYEAVPPLRQRDWSLPQRLRFTAKEPPSVNLAAIQTVPAVNPEPRQYDWPLASVRLVGAAEGQFLNPSPYYPPAEPFRPKGWIEPRHRPNNPDGPNARSRRKQAEQELADAISRLARQEPKPAPAAFRVKGIPSGSEVFVPGLEIVLPPPKPAKAKRVRGKREVQHARTVQAPPRVEVSVLMLHPPGIPSTAAVGRPVIHDHERDAMDALLAIERLLAHRP